MTCLFRRYARLLCVAGGVSLAGLALAATPGATPTNVSPSQTRLQAMKVEVALLGDPATRRLPVAVLLEGDTIVLRGEVPDEPTRHRAVELARQSCYLAVRDGLNVVRQALVDAKALKKAARDTLVRNLGSKADRLALVSNEDGQIKLEGEVATVEEKLHASRALREVPGCSRVINCLTVRGQGLEGRPITLVSSDIKGVVCTPPKPERAEPRLDPPVQQVRHADELPLVPPLPAPTVPSGLAQVPVVQVPATPRPTPPVAVQVPVSRKPAPSVQVSAIPKQKIEELPFGPPLPAPTVPSGLAQVPVVQVPATPRPTPPVAVQMSAPPKPMPPAVVRAPVTPRPMPTATVQVAPPPASPPCACSQTVVSEHERPSMLDKLMAWKNARATRKQQPVYSTEVLMPKLPTRGMAKEEVMTVKPVKQARMTKPSRVEPIPVSTARVSPTPTPSAEQPSVPAETTRQEAPSWPAAYRSSPVTPTPAYMSYVSRPLASASTTPPPPPVPYVAPPAPRARPVAMVPSPTPPVAPPTVVQTSSAPEPRVPSPTPTRPVPATDNAVMKVNVAEVPPIRMTENALKKRLSDTCGKLAKDVRIELVPDGSVIVHIYAMPATEHLLMARLLHMHELGAKNVQLHVHLAN